jgi:hypothetical protein
VGFIDRKRSFEFHYRGKMGQLQPFDYMLGYALVSRAISQTAYFEATIAVKPAQLGLFRQHCAGRSLNESASA